LGKANTGSFAYRGKHPYRVANGLPVRLVLMATKLPKTDDWLNITSKTDGGLTYLKNGCII
jgi:hypothetical protein